MELKNKFKLMSLKITVLFGLLHCLNMEGGVLFSAYADYIPPGDVQIETISYSPESNQLKAGTYYYKITWQGLPVAKAEVEVLPPDTTSGLRRVIARTRTSGFVSAFYKMKHRSESVFYNKTFRPVHFSSNQREQRSDKYREVDFRSDGSVRAARWKKGKEKKVVDFKTKNSIFDPISAAFLAKSVPMHEGQEVSFDVFNGKHRYLISFKVEGKEELKIQNRKHEAFKVTPTVKKLTDSKGEKKLKSASLWVTANENREILKLESKVWIGSVVANFEKFVPAKSELPAGLIEVKKENSSSLLSKEPTARARMKESNKIKD